MYKSERDQKSNSLTCHGCHGRHGQRHAHTAHGTKASNGNAAPTAIHGAIRNNTTAIIMDNGPKGICNPTMWQYISFSTFSIFSIFHNVKHDLENLEQRFKYFSSYFYNEVQSSCNIIKKEVARSDINYCGYTWNRSCN